MFIHLRNRYGFYAYVAGFIAMLTWFKWVDVYHDYFAKPGALVLIYNLARILFIFYFFWIVSTTGELALRVAFGKPKKIGTLEQLTLNFFAGAGVWHNLMLALGYLSLYTAPVAIAATTPLVALSWPSARRAFQAAQRLHVTCVSVPIVLAAGTAIFLGAIVLLVKGLYPGTNHDYMTHYFQSYLAVIREGGLWPNEVWYHYYYSKGAGLFFLGMLLTDALAPQLVTFCFVATAGAAIYLMVKQAASNPIWPWIAVTLFFATYINTPLSGEFEKHHEINSAMLVGLVWMAARALTVGERRDKTIYSAGAAVAIIGAVIHSSTAGPFLAAVFGLIAIALVISRRYVNAVICVGFISIAASTLIFIFLISYLTTGIADDHSLLAQWRFADVDKINQIGTLVPVLRLHYALSYMGAGAASMPYREALSNLADFARRFTFLPFLAVGVVVLGTALLHRWRTGNWPGKVKAPYEIALLIAVTLLTVGLGLTSGLVQPMSFFRYTSFVAPVFIVLGISIWNQPIAAASPLFIRITNDWKTPFLLLPLVLYLMSHSMLWQSDFVQSSMIARSLRFATGGYSLDDAYSYRTLWYPNGGIHPGARKAYAIAGPDTRIWTMNVHNYCMLPDCRIETPDAVTLGTGAYDIYYGSPEAARAALKSAGRNYFLYSINFPMDDNLPQSALFSPDKIADYLGVRWTDGTTTLLTWLGPDTKPLDAKWLVQYKSIVGAGKSSREVLFAKIKLVYDRLKATPHPWRSPDLPWESMPPG